MKDIEFDGTLVLDGPAAGVSFGIGTSGASPAGTQTLTYDNSGSLAGGFGLTYEYDDANRLKRVSKAGAIIEEYVYDHDGRRFKKISGGETTYYIGKDYETKINSSGTFNTIYYYANNELVGRKDSDGSTKYYHNDHLGGTHVVTDGSGNEVPGERTRYKPFGGIITGGVGEIGWTGHRWDKQTKQVYMVGRYYRPDLRRFTQADTVIPETYNPQALNRYSYTLNNPLKLVDPDGHRARTTGITVTLGAWPISKTGSISGGIIQAYSKSGKITAGYYLRVGKGSISPTASISLELGDYQDIQEVKEFSGETTEGFGDVSITRFAPTFPIPVTVGGGDVYSTEEDSSESNKIGKTYTGGIDANLPPGVSGGVTNSDTAVLETTGLFQFDLHGVDLQNIIHSEYNELLDTIEEIKEEGVFYQLK